MRLLFFKYKYRVFISKFTKFIYNCVRQNGKALCYRKRKKKVTVESFKDIIVPLLSVMIGAGIAIIGSVINNRMQFTNEKNKKLYENYMNTHQKFYNPIFVVLKDWIIRKEEYKENWEQYNTVGHGDTRLVLHNSFRLDVLPKLDEIVNDNLYLVKFQNREKIFRAYKEIKKLIIWVDESKDSINDLEVDDLEIILQKIQDFHDLIKEMVESEDNVHQNLFLKVD